MIRRVRWITALAVICLLPLLAGAFVLQRKDAAKRRADQDTQLANTASAEALRLDQYFAEARKLITYAARSADFTGYAQPGGLDRANAALGVFERLYPQGIGEACLISNG